MALTSAEVNSTLNTVAQLQAAVSDLFEYVQNVQQLINAGWVDSSAGAPINIQASDQAAILSVYQGKKTALATIYEQLP